MPSNYGVKRKNDGSECLCALRVTSLICFRLLLRSYLSNRIKLLFWSSLAFFFFAIQNVILFIDLVIVSQTDTCAVAHSHRIHWCTGPIDCLNLGEQIMPEEMLNFLRGGTMVGLVGSAVFFLRYWRQTRIGYLPSFRLDLSYWR